VKGLSNNFTFEIGFERIKRQFLQNKDIDGRRSTKIHELEHFEFGAVTIQTTTEQLSNLHAANGKNKHLGALRIPYLCTG